MKPKYITVENYKKFKPSEFIRSFVSDIEVVEKTGKTMNMDTYTSRGRCLPCLGGMACLNFGVTLSDEGIYDKVNSVLSTTAFLGDSIRRGHQFGVKLYIEKLYGDLPIPTHNSIEDLHRFHGTPKATDLQALKEQVHKFADAYEALGY